MPIKHAAQKQMRKDQGRQQRNQAVRSELRTATRQLLALLQGQRFDEARKLLSSVAGHYDRAVAKGVMHRNTAARFKSRVTRRINRGNA